MAPGDGLFMTVSIVFACRQSAFTLNEAFLVPLPQLEEDMGVKWKMEAVYLAVSESLRETSFGTRDQLDKCLGFSEYGICHGTLTTEDADSSLCTLYFGNNIDALEVCDTGRVSFPLKGKATIVVYGKWPITSALANW